MMPYNRNRFAYTIFAALNVTERRPTLAHLKQNYQVLPKLQSSCCVLHVCFIYYCQILMWMRILTNIRGQTFFKKQGSQRPEQETRIATYRTKMNRLKEQKRVNIINKNSAFSHHQDESVVQVMLFILSLKALFRTKQEFCKSVYH